RAASPRSSIREISLSTPMCPKNDASGASHTCHYKLKLRCVQHAPLSRGHDESELGVLAPSAVGRLLQFFQQFGEPLLAPCHVALPIRVARVLGGEPAADHQRLAVMSERTVEVADGCECL